MGKANKKSARQLVLDGIEFHSNDGAAVARYDLVGANGKVIKHYTAHCADVKGSFGGVRTARGEMKEQLVRDVLGYNENIANDEQLLVKANSKMSAAKANLQVAQNKYEAGEIFITDLWEYQKAVSNAERDISVLKDCIAVEHKVKAFVEKYWADRL